MVKKGNRIKGLLKLVALQVSLALLLLALIEAGFRLFLPQVNKTIFINGKPLAKRDADLGYVLNPGSITRHKFSEFDVTYSINEQGFNQPENVKPDTVQHKVLFLGDSYTFGMGTTYAESYVGLISANLPAKYSTINAGVLGYHTGQEFGLLSRLLPLYKPEIVCLQVVSNDFQQVGGDNFDAASNLADTSIKWDEHQRWRLHTLDFIKRMLIQNDRLYYAIAKKQNDHFEATIRKNADTLANLVKQISNLCKAYNCKLIVFFYPSKFMITQRQFESGDGETILTINDKLISVLSANGHDYFNPLKTIAEDYAMNKMDHHYRLDGHCTPYGNAFLARILEQKLTHYLH